MVGLKELITFTMRGIALLIAGLFIELLYTVSVAIFAPLVIVVLIIALSVSGFVATWVVGNIK